MATEQQYEFFRLLFEEEERRYALLETRGKVYMSIIAVFLAALVMRADEVETSAKTLGVPWVLLVTDAAMFAVALLFVVFGFMIRTYEAITTPQSVIDQFGVEPMEDADFFDDRIADLAIATERNTKVNDRCARHLSIAGALLACAMAFFVFLLVAAAPR